MKATATAEVIDINDSKTINSQDIERNMTMNDEIRKIIQEENQVVLDAVKTSEENTAAQINALGETISNEITKQLDRRLGKDESATKEGKTG